MLNRSLQSTALAAVFLLCALSTTAQKVKEPTFTNKEWTTPYQPFRIAGNLYYVGTYDLACYLITTPKGNILINTGTAASATQIRNNINKLGFRYADTKILLTTQAHYDHMGAMAVIKKQTGAKLMVQEKEADVLKTGGSSDYALGGEFSTFTPVLPDKLLQDGDTISLGGMHLVLLHHPGHTKGSCSYLLTVKDNKRSYKVLIANMPTIVTEKPFAEVTEYSSIAADYAHTLKAMKNISFDIWVASHASQFDLHKKHKPGAPYNPAAFFDQAGYDEGLADLQKEYDERAK